MHTEKKHTKNTNRFLQNHYSKESLKSVVSPLEGDAVKHYEVCTMKWPSRLKAQEPITFSDSEENVKEVLQNLVWSSENIPNDQ